MPSDIAKSAPAHGEVNYTCPMHPAVRQDHPGTCPKCGMALEPVAPTSGGDDSDSAESAELRDMTRLFWIGAASSRPSV